jgi:DNA-binding PadR family transcriptional regulator
MIYPASPRCQARALTSRTKVDIVTFNLFAFLLEVDVSSSNDINDLLPLSPRAFYVLLSLAREETHGYAIAKTVASLTGGSVRLTPGTLYPIIRQMLVDGWITELPEDGVDSRRRRYRLSARGRRIARAEAARLDDLVRMARDLELLPGRAT